MEKEKELLPIGSVVHIKDSTSLVMVAGYLPISQKEPERIWSYSGFRFPLGFTNDDEVYCFNHDQIQRVYAYGYRDIEHDIFMERLEKSFNEYVARTGDSEPATAAANDSEEE